MHHVQPRMPAPRPLLLGPVRLRPRRPAPPPRPPRPSRSPPPPAPSPLGEQILLCEVGQTADPHTQQPHPAGGVHRLQQPRRGLPYDRRVVGGAAQRLGAGQRREVVVAHLDDHRAPRAPGGPQPLHAAVGEPQHLAPHPGPVGQIDLEGVLDRDGLRVPLGHHRPVVPAQRHRIQPGAVRLAQQPHQLGLTGLRGLRDGVDPGPAQRLGRRGAHPGQRPHRHRAQQLPLGTGLDHHQAVRLGRLGRDLGQHLGAREPHRAGQAGGGADVAAAAAPPRARTAAVSGGTPPASRSTNASSRLSGSTSGDSACSSSITASLTWR